MKVTGKNRTGTESYAPLETVMRFGNQTYAADIWPVGVIFLQFVLRKNNIFNSVRIIQKDCAKNHFFVNYIIQLASFYGDQIFDQMEALGFKLTLPKDIEHFTFR